MDTLANDIMGLPDLEDPTIGYCVLRGFGQAGDVSETGRRLDVRLGDRYRHIQVFASYPAWKPIKVDPTRDPHRVGGVGPIPLHLDFVNMECPPDIVVLWCTAADSTGGGRSLLCSVRVLIEACPGDVLERLKHTSISEGQAYGLSNVGEALPSFRIFDPSSVFPLRYTGKILAGNPDHPQRRILREVEEVAASLVATVSLAAGDVLIVNQRFCLHGREPLGTRPDGSVDVTRTVMQRFYRLNPELSAL